MNDQLVQTKVDKQTKKRLEELAKLDMRTLADYIRVQLVKIAQTTTK